MSDIKNSVWLPSPASNFHAEVDPLFYFILWASTVIFAIVVFAIILFCVKYRNESVRDKLEPQVSHDSKLEFFWTLIPTILIVIVFFWGARSFLKMRIWPVDATEINVKAKNYQFSFNYRFENKMFGVKDTLVVPIGEPIKLVMSAEKTSFLHGLFIPDFRVKSDVSPHRYSQMWFVENNQGVYDYYCTEYCGAGHSGMNGKVIVMSKNDYDDWFKGRIELYNQSLTYTGAQLGEYLYKELACNTCHSSIENEVIQGPSFAKLWGTRVEHVNAGPEIVDENYIEESIRYPALKIVKGYNNLMPKDYVDLSKTDIDALIEFIKTLK